MVTQLDPSVMEEIAEVEAAGLRPQELMDVRQAITSDVPVGAEQVRKRDGTVAQQGFTYIIPPTEAAQWIPAWRMEYDQSGVVYGRPMVSGLNIQQLGLHLSRRMEDFVKADGTRINGGRLFTIKMPERVAPQGRFQCFVIPQQCHKLLSTKGDLLDHSYGFHPTAAAHMHEELEMIRKSMNKDNMALQQTVQQLIDMPDQGWVEPPEELRAESAASVEGVNVHQGEELPDPLSVPQIACELCSWIPGPTVNAAKALRMHVMVKHKDVT